MNIILYKFNKRDNSTKRPGNGKTVSGRLNNSSSVMSPTISFTSNLHSYNYAYIGEFGRFYYISDWLYNNGMWTAQMNVDVLATYRSEIGGSSQYVVRSSAAYDEYVVDSLYPAKGKVKNSVETVNIWNSDLMPVSQYFIIGIVGGVTSESTGIVTYYQMNASQFTKFSNMVFGSTDYIGTDFGTDMTLDYLRTQINPFQYIVSVTKYPFKVKYTASTSTIKLGWWNIAFNCEIVNNNLAVHNDFIKIPIPKHPQISRGRFLSLSPYSRYNLYLPYCGTKELPSEIMQNSEYLYITISTDVTANSSIVFVQLNGFDSSNSIMQYNGVIGQSVIIGQSTTNVLGAGMNVLSAVGNLLTGNFIGAVSSVSDAAANLSPTLTTSGENTGFAEASAPAKLACTFLYVCDEDNENNGKPLMQVKTISSLPGYIKCENADVSITGTDSECEKIKSFMNGGFFYE